MKPNLRSGPFSVTSIVLVFVTLFGRVQFPSGAAEPDDGQSRYWLENMLVHHRYSVEEAAAGLGWIETMVRQTTAELGLLNMRPTPRLSDGTIRVLPYPGGRHPRIGFLEGAIDPMRGTKVSLFAPWADGGYVVLDLPEAIFSNLGLTFLAHKHIPTIWDQQNTTIRNVDWNRDTSGKLRSTWRLPNGIVFGAHVTPNLAGADFELWLENGTDAPLTEMRTQVCLMLKGATGFNSQDQERKEYEPPLVVARAVDHERYILLAFDRCGRAWGNKDCPCLHSDPVLPDAAPGDRVSVRGRLLFHEGSDIEQVKRRLVADLKAVEQ